MRILITGLPGSGKSTLAENMVEHMNNTQHLNADVLRQEANDWDFSPEGRKRQAIRMRERADCHMGPTIADFVAPTQELRDIYDPHYTIFLDTIKEGRFADTNAIYEKPTNANRVNRRWLNKEDTGRLVYTMYREVTAGVMIGRYQPFHDGHFALAQEILKKHPIVRIWCRQVPFDKKNPYNYMEVSSRIIEKMEPYSGRFIVEQIPNIGGVYYGRDVGYNVEKIELPPEIQAISATAIRAREGR